MAKRFSLSFSLFLLLSDLAFTIGALALATQARLMLPFGKIAPDEIIILPLPVYVLVPLIWVATFIAMGVYDPKYSARLFEEVQRIVWVSAFAWLAMTGTLYMTYRIISRLQIVYFAIIVVGLVVLHRTAIRGFFRLTGGRSYDAHNVLIVGTGEIAYNASQMIQSYAWAGLYLVGFAGDDPVVTAPGGAVSPAPVVGPVTNIQNIVRDLEISEVVVALPSHTDIDVRQLVYDLHTNPINLRIVPDYFDLAFLRLKVEDFGGMPLLSLKEPILTPFERLVKRVFDLIVTSIGLVPALPILGIIALAIRLDTPGPAIYKQARIGEGGKIFTMYKFRTMELGADQRQDEVNTLDEQGNIIHKHADDPRVTKVGAFLRRNSLDELPQVFNVVLGQMSLVGPRPEMPWLVDKYEQWQRKRFEVPQGITGWWQVSGRSDKIMHLHTEEDLFYIRNYSIWLDVQILWQTIGAVIRRRGAF